MFFSFSALSNILVGSIFLTNTAGLPLYTPQGSVSPISKLPAAKSTPSLKVEPGKTIALVPILEKGRRSRLNQWFNKSSFK